MVAVIATPEFVDLEAPAVARAILRHIVEHADAIGQDERGRTILRFDLGAPPWLLDKLASLGAQDEDREDDDPAEDGEG